MYYQDYNSFVRPHSPTKSSLEKKASNINGAEAQKLYLEEISNSNTNKTNSVKRDDTEKPRKSKRKITESEISNNKLFVAVQNNDVETLRQVINHYPYKLNILDDYGWSLLMIACQADARDCVEELLKYGIDVNIRDSAGDSARSLVIRNKNFSLADMLLKYSENCKSNKAKSQIYDTKAKVKCKERYMCSLCNNSYPDKEEHLSSTIHNINASKGKKILTKYDIPISNKGFQMLLKGGWDKETGLGLYGTGRKCPIRTIPKNDRTGLGHKMSNEAIKCIKTPINYHNKKTLANNYMKNKRMEIDFRREFY